MPSPESAETIIAELDQAVSQFETVRERLSPAMAEDEFLQVLRQYEEIARSLQRLSGYAYLWFSEQTQHQSALVFLGRVE